MQYGQHTNAGGGGISALLSAQPGAQAWRHRSLLLIAPDRPARLTPGVARRVLDRLLVPSAQVEGVDFHLADPALPQAAALAGGFVLVLPPLGNLSNALYSVHPRRNDRFVTARAPLKALYPEVDFAAFAFTGHALTTLAATCPERFAQVRQILAATWVSRMRQMLDLLPPRGALLDLAPPAWLPRPPIPGEGRRRILVDPDDRARGAEGILLLLGRL